MKRKRINLTTMCVYSTGDTQVVSREEQAYREHLFRLKKIDEISKREKSNMHTTVVVKKQWNPERHKYAIAYGGKIKITCEKDYNLFIECGCKIVDK